MKNITLCTLLFLGLYASSQNNGPKILVVTAHPDDETGMAATIYKVTHELKWHS
jgi:hypothetical protein